MNAYHLHRIPDRIVRSGNESGLILGREYIANADAQCMDEVVQSVQAESWIAAKQALGFDLTAEQSIRLAAIGADQKGAKA